VTGPEYIPQQKRPFAIQVAPFTMILMGPNETELLKQAVLFRNIQPETLDTIIAIAIVRMAEEGSYFFQEQDPATHLYILAQGRIKLCQVTVDGQQVALRMIVPGQMFGGVAILKPDSVYPASALVMEDSQALAFEGKALSKLSEKDPALSLNMMQLMSIYITEMQTRFREVTTERVERRVARTILRLAAAAGSKVDNGVEVSISRQDVAEMTGTTIFSVSRILSEWERQGLIVAGRERVVICNPHELVRISEDLTR
jgi:CRP-like cAMP-binding protein